jgi:RNA polymerase sigma-70 factor (ECF subfamily)
MSPTSVSLLQRLRQAGADDPDWQRLDNLYRPLLRAWLTRVPGLGDEADDLAQDVLVVVFRKLHSFERRRDGSFRAWLRKITVNRIRRRVRDRRKPGAAAIVDATGAFLDMLEDAESGLSRQWNDEHDRHVLAKLLNLVRPDFEPDTWEAFTRFALDGRPAAAVAKELGTTQEAVFQAKFRILKRLREEATILTDEK